MRISLVTACINSALVIQDNLSSVLQQVGEIDLEHLFQDGSSTDETIQLLSDYKDIASHVVSIESGQDEGFYDAINNAMRRTSGEVVGLLNADDYFADVDVLSTVTGIFKMDPSLDVLYADLDFVREKRKEERRKQKSKTSASFERRFEVVRRWRAGTFSPQKFSRGWVPPHPTVYVRRRVFEKIGSYRLDFGTSADYEWLLRLFMKPPSGYSPRLRPNMKDPDCRTRPKLSPSGLYIQYLPKVLVHMRLGGQSTASIKNRLIANRNDFRAWKVNALNPSLFFRLLKPVRKLHQWL